MSTDSSSAHPLFVSQLEQNYGAPSQNAFGSAVFFDPANEESTERLEDVALARHRHFCGETWSRFGEENWMRTWQQVYSRATDAKRDIVAELKSLDDADARRSASMLLDGGLTADATQVLAQAFDAAEVSELRVFKMGDGGAMSGVLIAAKRPEGILCLTFLLD